MVFNEKKKKKIMTSKLDIEVASTTSSSISSSNIQKKPFKNSAYNEKERKKLRNTKQIMDLTLPNYPIFNCIHIYS